MSLSRRRMLAAAALVSTAALSGCGFRLRGQFSVPFETIYLDMNRNTPFAARLTRQLRSGSGVTLVESPDDAQAVLRILANTLTREIVSYNANGDAREYEIKLTVRFRLASPKGEEFLPDSAITAMREISYSDTDYLSRDSEEALLINEMQADIVSQMIRRIEKAKPVQAAPEDETELETSSNLTSAP